MLQDLAIEIHRRLYPESDELARQAKVSTTAAANQILSLAQEYETAFERANLHQLLHHLIRDDDPKPGNTHSRLLQLPWRDVFTTNWDTLLERARPQVLDRAYSVVRDMDEIPLADRPRILKLHGSFPAQFPLILTEEDYRTYPTKFAPFVNTVQQAMMETVFCLIEFSGNDPNFLKWSGWVRDNLGASAPRIYLAGWLDLPHHRRRMLESRGVVPIDLAQHPMANEWPEHQRYHNAIEWVLHTLERGRPYDLTYWPLPISLPYSAIPRHLEPVVQITSKQPKEEPTWETRVDNDMLHERVKETLDIWRHNRQLYPGWIVFPSGEERQMLSACTDNWEPMILESLSSLVPVERLSALRELVWRRGILLEPISDQLEAAAEEVLESIDCQGRTINKVADPRIDWGTVREAWWTVAHALVTAARFRFDNNLFDKRTEALGPFVSDHPDVFHRLRQEHCLQGVYSMDFETLERLLEDWDVGDCDPIWMIRKAALFWESDRNDQAAELIKQALDAIRSNPDSDGRVTSASREGWAMWSAFTMEKRQEFRKRWDELAALKCDAMLERDLIARQINDSGGSREAPVFDLGVRRGERLRFSNAVQRRRLAAYRAIRLSEVTGLRPAIAASILKLASAEIASTSPELAVRLVLTTCTYENDETIQNVLSRTRIALMSVDLVQQLVTECTNLVEYGVRRG